METFAKGDVVLFPFPYTDMNARKIRPCLVLSDEMQYDILLCQITSKHVQADKYSVEIKKNETTDGSLQIDSLIRSNMLFTAEKLQIIKKICKLDERKYKDVVEKVIQLISV